MILKLVRLSVVLDAPDECNKLAREDLITQLCCFYSAQNQEKDEAEISGNKSFLL